jgi:hypothetical protein
MPSVTTHNLGTVASQVTPTAHSNTQTQVSSPAANLNAAQVAQISKVAADRQTMNPARSDTSRAPSKIKQTEANYAAQSKGAKRAESKVDPETRSRPKEDGLMDVVA